MGSTSFELPVVAQPGQAEDTIAVALGYGRGKDVGGKVSEEAGGVNVYPLLHTETQVGIELTSKKEDIAQTQTHHTIMNRESIIQESTLSEYQKDPKAGRFEPHIATYSGKTKPGNLSLWDVDSDGYGDEKKDKKKDKSEGVLLWNEKIEGKDSLADRHIYKQHHWGLAIDLNACTGCSACVTACHLENNVPVVGKKEVIRRREMHWLRIDRYYSVKEGSKHYKDIEQPSDMPEVVFQPMMCQHCNNAPCETVCPVAATTHSSEGLNQMTYNRCVGTKYCANNCPYKVRRFNWFKYHNNEEFDYHLNSDLGKMVLNPDVTVRSRGVMEKCSMCVQRIQAGKLEAKKNSRKLIDSDVSTACSQVCPTNAIVFGDLNEGESAIRKMMDREVEERAYNVIEEVGTKPNVWYLTKIRNKA